jgi:hypothetical protein
MDIKVFNISFANFLTAFRKFYKLSDNSYDYMAFLNDFDRTSYCGMMDTYKNPNKVLNDILTPSLNNIQIIGRKTPQMKGGGKHQLLLIALMYILSVSNVFAGPYHNTFKTTYGDDMTKWPKEPKEPKNRWNGFLFTLGPSTADQKAYNQSLAEYNTFIGAKKEAYKELENEQSIKLINAKTENTKAETENTEAKTENTKAETYQTQVLVANNLYEELLKIKGENMFLKGLIAGGFIISIIGGSVIGLIFYYINNNNANRRLETYNVDGRITGRPEIDNVDGRRSGRLAIDNVDGRRSGRFEIDNVNRNEIHRITNGRTYGGRTYGGKKTKKHRKRTNRQK